MKRSGVAICGWTAPMWPGRFRRFEWVDPTTDGGALWAVAIACCLDTHQRTAARWAARLAETRTTVRKELT